MIGQPLKLIEFLYVQDKDKLFEVKEYKEKRNNNQNSRYWTLLYKLSLKLKIGVQELHKQMLRDYSKQGVICALSDYDMSGVKYYDIKSKFKKDGKEYIVYHVYTPSHELKTDEFAILLDGLIQACEEQGIDTRSPSEILMEEQIYGRNMERY